MDDDAWLVVGPASQTLAKRELVGVGVPFQPFRDLRPLLLGYMTGGGLAAVHWSAEPVVESGRTQVGSDGVEAANEEFRGDRGKKEAVRPGAQVGHVLRQGVQKYRNLVFG